MVESAVEQESYARGEACKGKVKACRKRISFPNKKDTVRFCPT